MHALHHILAFTLVPNQTDIANNGLGAVTELLINAIDIAIYAAGALSVIFVIVGGFRYVISGGNPGDVVRAKATITYALVGLFVSILAVTIVNYVATLFK